MHILMSVMHVRRAKKEEYKDYEMLSPTSCLDPGFSSGTLFEPPDRTSCLQTNDREIPMR